MVTTDFITNRQFASCGVVESTEPAKGSTTSRVLIASSANHPTGMDDNNGKNKKRHINGVPSFVNPLTGRLTPLAWAAIIFGILFIFYSMNREKGGGGTGESLRKGDEDSIEERAQNPKFQHVLAPLADPDPDPQYLDGARVNLKGVDRSNNLKGVNDIGPADLAIDFPEKPLAPAQRELPAPKPKEFPVDLIVKPDLLCPDKPYVLFLVTSSPVDVLARTAIRRTWGHRDGVSTASQLGMSWRTVFAMGQRKSKGDQIQRESKHFGDVLQGKFDDLKSEDTRKVMMGFRWAARDIIKTCQPKYVFKTSAKVYINVPLIIKWIEEKLKNAPDLYVGKLLRDDHPIRDKHDPYYVPRSDYPGNVFPNMARGPLYVISMNVVQRMVAKIGQVTPIAMEDAYVGLLAARVGVTLTNDDHFVLIKKPSNFCHYSHMMFVFGVEPTELMSVYNVVEQKHRIAECGDRGF